MLAGASRAPREDLVMADANPDMRRFRYRASSVGGMMRSGVIDAPSPGRAANLLGRRGMTALQLEEVCGERSAPDRSSGWTSRRAKPTFRANIYGQLALLLDAGCPLDRALQIMRIQQSHFVRAQELARIETAVAGGHALSRAVREVWPHSGKDEFAMIAAGERAASLPSVLAQIAASLDRRQELGRRIGSALIYPAFLVTMTPVILLAVTFILVPNLAPLFRGSGEIPLALRTMMAVHWLLTEHPAITAAGAGLAAALAVSLFSAGRQRGGPVLFTAKAPFIARVMQSLATVRLCRLLSTLLGGGVPLQSALKILQECAGTEEEAQRIRRVAAHVSGGRRLSAALELESVLAPGATALISIGEEANRVDAMLLHVIRHEESKALATIDAAVTLLAPCATLIVGLLVGGIILSVMRAILSINQFALQ